MTPCFNKAKAAAAGKLTDEEILEAFEREQKIRQAILDSGKTDNLDARVANQIVKHAMEKKIEAARLLRQTAQNIKVRIENDAQVAAFRKAGMSPVEALRSLHEGSQKSVDGARKSSYAQGLAYEAKWVGGVTASVQKERPHIFKRLHDRSFDDAVTREMYELREGGEPGKTGDSDAIWLAKELATFMEESRQELNRLGAAIGKLDGYSGPQVHDDLMMMKAGREKWVEDTFALLDIGRTFETVASEAEAMDALRGVYDTIITGISNQDGPLLKGQRIGPANLAKRLGKHRVLHFRDADAAIAYRDLYGSGSTVSGIMNQMRRHAHMAGTFDRWGPNPKAMVLAMAERMRKDMKSDIAAAPSEKARAKLQKQADELLAQDGVVHALQATVDELTGTLSTPVPGSAAQINANIRAGLAMSKLGGAVLTAIPSDTVTMAFAAMQRGQGFWNGIFSVLDEMANGPDGKEIGFLLGEGFDGLIGHMSSAAVPWDSASGVMAKTQEQFYRWSGLTKWTDAARSVAARMAAAHLGKATGKGFDQLHPATAQVLKLNGIDAARWDAIRAAGVKEVNGNIYLTPDRIRDLPDDVISPLVADKLSAAKSEAKKSAIIKQARQELEMDLRRYYADETSYGVIETDAKSRRIATLGTRPGTLVGEAVRYIMQFKGFPIAFTQRVLGRWWYNPQMGMGNRALNMGAMMAGLTMAGYMSMTLKDMSRGLWPPRDITDQRTVVAAMLQGGAVGIYGDFLFAEKSRFGNSQLATLMGPGVSEAESIYNMAIDARDALQYQDAKAGHRAAGEGLNLAIQSTPFANLFYTRAALDMLFINSLRESLNPGTLKRQETRLKNERNQEYFLPRTLTEALR